LLQRLLLFFKIIHIAQIVFNSKIFGEKFVLTQNKASAGVRVIEIILGLIAIAIGAYILIYPGLTIATVTFLVAIGLFLVGIFRIGWGLISTHVSGAARGVAILIGLIAVGIAIVVMLYPLLAAATVVILISIAVLIYGIGRIVIGATSGQLGGGLRGLLVATGLLMVILAIVVIVYPGLGIVFLAVLLSIAFLFIGFESIAAGIVGARYAPPQVTTAVS
jgi:uncharacterized membrane protein HdeD (DUF308 family)